MRIRLSIYIVSLVLLFPMLAVSQQASSESKLMTVLDGAYSAEQAARGQTAYVKVCARCHGQNLEGHVGGYEGGGAAARTLIGDVFIDRWREDNLVELYTLIRTGMPRGQERDNAVVTDAEKLDILTYILQRNGYPAGKTELRAEALGNVQLLGKNGPKPLPSESPVWTVGCLVKGSDNNWLLKNAADASKTSAPDETNANELKRAETRPLGSATFKLPNLDRAIPGIKPAPLENQKVQIKGIFYKDTDMDRINVKSMKSVAPSCGT